MTTTSLMSYSVLHSLVPIGSKIKRMLFPFRFTGSHSFLQAPDLRESLLHQKLHDHLYWLWVIHFWPRRQNGEICPLYNNAHNEDKRPLLTEGPSCKASIPWFNTHARGRSLNERASLTIAFPRAGLWAHMHDSKATNTIPELPKQSTDMPKWLRMARRTSLESWRSCWKKMVHWKYLRLWVGIVRRRHHMWLTILENRAVYSWKQWSRWWFSSRSYSWATKKSTKQWSRRAKWGASDSYSAIEVCIN